MRPVFVLLHLAEYYIHSFRLLSHQLLPIGQQSFLTRLLRTSSSVISSSDSVMCCCAAMLGKNPGLTFIHVVKRPVFGHELTVKACFVDEKPDSTAAIACPLLLLPSPLLVLLCALCSHHCHRCKLSCHSPVTVHICHC